MAPMSMFTVRVHTGIGVPITLFAFFVALFVFLPIRVHLDFAHAAQNQNMVSAVDNSFYPGSLTIPVGSTVVWMNSGMMQHTVTADNGSFDSGTLPPGARFSRTFNTPGTYRYYCRLHGGPGGIGMSGTIFVTGSVSYQETPYYIYYPYYISYYQEIPYYYYDTSVYYPFSYTYPYPYYFYDDYPLYDYDILYDPYMWWY